jgi:hypothetical protein
LETAQPHYPWLAQPAAAADGRGYDPKAAGSQGIQVSQRGRVPADLVAKFQAANT